MRRDNHYSFFSDVLEGFYEEINSPAQIRVVLESPEIMKVLGKLLTPIILEDFSSLLGFWYSGLVPKETGHALRFMLYAQSTIEVKLWR